MSEATMSSMSTGIRGFSFMPEQKIEVTSLQYVEDEDLQRTWKSSRRQRLKQQEQKIWDEFVKEQDVLSTVCTDDPYQFLEQLPETCLKELMEAELEKMKNDHLEENKIEDQKPEGDGDISRGNDRPEEVTVTFSEDVEIKDDKCDMFHIFDDEKDDEKEDDVEEPSGAELEDATQNESSNPSPNSTVRERHSSPSPQPSPPTTDRRPSKLPENVGHMIESSIYCAKVRDLRPKICEEMLSIIESLEQRNIMGIEPEELAKMCRRSTEFCARFNRIYMYQLHRQLHDIKRNSSVSLPFARHTQFQSQMVRIVSLHQNLLQSLQVFHRSLEQTAMAGEGAALLRGLLALAAAAAPAARALPPPATLLAAHGLYDDVFHRSLEQTAMAGEGAALLRGLLALAAAAAPAARALPPPATLLAAHGLYDDDMLTIVEKVDHVVTEYATRMSDYMTSTNKTDSLRSKRTSSLKKKSVVNWSKIGSKKKPDADSRLSMYSLDTLRINLHPKSSSSKDNQSSGTSKVRGGLSCNGRKSDGTTNNQQPPKSSRKSPRSRRPLMRAPASGRGRGRAARDADIRTMVEAVEPCTSNYMSREGSPRHSDKNIKSPTPQQSRNPTPRAPKDSPRKYSPEKTKKLSSPIVGPKKPISPKCLRPPLNIIQSGTEDSQSLESMPKIFTKEASEASYGMKKVSPQSSPRPVEEVIAIAERGRKETLNLQPGRCEVTRIVRQLCGGDTAGGRNERVSGAKNAQLHCVNGASPRQPSTPQLLRILEETIQKKVPKTLFHKTVTANKMDRFRLAFNIPERTAELMFQYRTKFVQHMLASPMYANCAIKKPWEMIGSISEQLIDDLLGQCTKEMEQDILQELCKVETR